MWKNYTQCQCCCTRVSECSRKWLVDGITIHAVKYGQTPKCHGIDSMISGDLPLFNSTIKGASRLIWFAFSQGVSLQLSFILKILAIKPPLRRQLMTPMYTRQTRRLVGYCQIPFLSLRPAKIATTGHTIEQPVILARLTIGFPEERAEAG